MCSGGKTICNNISWSSGVPTPWEGICHTLEGLTGQLKAGEIGHGASSSYVRLGALQGGPSVCLALHSRETPCPRVCCVHASHTSQPLPSPWAGEKTEGGDVWP